MSELDAVTGATGYSGKYITQRLSAPLPLVGKPDQGATVPLDKIRYNIYIDLVTGKLKAKIKQKAPFSSIEEEVYLNVLRTAEALSREVENLLRPRGLSVTQYNVLRILRGAGRQGLTCGETGERMVTHDPDITRLLDRLEKQGLISRSRDARDRRVVTARITPRGLQLVRSMDKPIEDLQQKMFRHMSPKNLNNLSSLLEEVWAGKA